MRSWVLIIVLTCVCGGCGHWGVPQVTKGMRAEEVSAVCMRRTFPPAIPITARLYADGTIKTMYVQEWNGTHTYTIVDERDGVVVRVEYEGTGF